MSDQPPSPPDADAGSAVMRAWQKFAGTDPEFSARLDSITAEMHQLREAASSGADGAGDIRAKLDELSARIHDLSTTIPVALGATPGQVRTTGDYIRLVRRQVRVIVLLAVVGALFGLSVPLVSPTEVNSRVLFTVGPIVGDPLSASQSPGENISLPSEIALLNSSAQADRVIAALSLDVEPEDLIDKVRVVSTDDAYTLRLSATDTDAELARAIAQAYAETYLAARLDAGTRTLDDHAERLQAQLLATQDQLREAIQTVADPTAAPEDVAVAGTVRDGLASVIQDLQTQLAATLSANPNPGEILSPATTPDPVGVVTSARLAVAGLALGLLVGLVLAVLREAARD